MELLPISIPVFPPVYSAESWLKSAISIVSKVRAALAKYAGL